MEHDRLLTSYRQEWAERFERDSDPNGACPLPFSRTGFSDVVRKTSCHGTDAACQFRVKLLPLYVADLSPAFAIS